MSRVLFLRVYLHNMVSATQTLLTPHMQGSDPHIEGSGPSNPYGFEGPRAVWSVWEVYKHDLSAYLLLRHVIRTISCLSNLPPCPPMNSDDVQQAPLLSAVSHGTIKGGRRSPSSTGLDQEIHRPLLGGC